MSKVLVIPSKISDFKVLKKEAQETAPVLHMSEAIERPSVLEARVYKIKPGEHAFYITISDIWLNKGTEHETCRPYEMFVNTKDMGAFQWIALASRLISAVMRKGGDLSFILEEMKSVFEPSGGFWMDGQYLPSIVAAIGNVLEEHMRYLGLVENKPISPKIDTDSRHPSVSGKTPLPQCSKCKAFAVVVQEGCSVCIECNYSKCG